MRFLLIGGVCILSLFAVASSAFAQPAADEPAITPRPALNNGDFGCSDNTDCPRDNSCITFSDNTSQCLGNYNAECDATTKCIPILSCKTAKDGKSRCLGFGD
jgi:hypothetical protein